MERYRNIQSLPNSPLSPLTPMKDNLRFDFDIGGDGSLDKYIYNKSPKQKGTTNNCAYRAKSSCLREPINTPKSRCVRCTCKKSFLKVPAVKIMPNVRCSPVKPKPISENLSKILQSHGLLKYLKLFENEEIDLDVFRSLSEIDLCSLGILDPKDQQTILLAVHYARCL